MRSLKQVVGASLGELVKGGREAQTVASSIRGSASRSALEYPDILDLVAPSRRDEARALIPLADAENGDAAGKLAHLILNCAEARSEETEYVTRVLDVSLHHKILQSGSLFLNLGNLLIKNGAVGEAMRAYVRSTAFHADNKWHAGQKIYEYVTGQEPGTPELLAILDGLDGAEDFVVPDLYYAIVDRAVHVEDFDLARLHGMCRTLGWGRVSSIGNIALAVGKHAVAMRAYDCAAVVEPGEIGLRLQMGITQFLGGRYRESEREWALTDYMRSSARERWGLSGKPLRFLGKSWFAAIGHVAFIDTYIKSMELGWRPKLPTAYFLDQGNPPPGAALLQRWARYIDVHSVTGDSTSLARKLIGYEAPAGEDGRFHAQRMEALTEEFWAGPDGEDRIRWYGPLGAEVERAWKEAGRGPLLEIGEDENRRTRKLLAQVFGLPEDAWFVALHVREPGFHAAWHKTHPGTRHADITTYERVVDFVTKAGGWVVRVGDRSMTTIPSRPQVIDYATSPFRNFDLDVFLCATCAYFIGTNSGLSLLPPLFGRRCVLTNWSPVAIPNWYLDDIYIPKLVRRFSENRHLTFREMYASNAGWTQWRRDYVEDIEVIEDNEPDDLVDAVEELHSEVIAGLKPTAEEQALIDRFNAIAVAGGSYVGSRIGARFASKYRHLLEG